MADDARELHLAMSRGERLRPLCEQLRLFEPGLHASVGAEGLAAAPPARALLIDAELLEEEGVDVRALRRRRAPAPILILSERGDVEARMRAVDAQAHGFVQLPIDAAGLIDRVEQLSPRAGEEPARVFILDDEVGVLELYAHFLAEAGVEAQTFSHARDMFEALEDVRPELFLLDLHMPEWSGRQIARALRQDQSFVGVPIVFLSADLSSDALVETIELGSDRYLTKPIEPDHLIKTVSAMVERFRHLRALMAHDSLTRLYNHTHFKSHLNAQIAQASRVGAPLALAMLDIDRFKDVNDRWGHPVGDRVLRGLAQLLRRRLRRSDVIGRYGGDEFAVLMPGTDAAGARGVLEEIRARFAALRFEARGEVFHVDFSCGVASHPSWSTEAALTRAADEALYAAKRAGRGRVELAPAPR